MPNIRSTGIFSDEGSGDLFRGFYRAATKTKVPGTAIGSISGRGNIEVFEDFTTGPVTKAIATEIGTVDDATIEAGTAGGGVYVSTHGTANEGHGSIQLASCGVAPAAGRVIACEISMSTTDITESDWFVGLGEVDTTFMAATGVLAVNGADNFVGYHSLDTTNVINLSSAGVAMANRQDTLFSALASAPTVPGDLEVHLYGFRIEGLNKIEFYYDGVKVLSRISDDDFAEIMVPTWANLAGGAENRMEIDYVLYNATR
jgi:hypothetical protein